MDSSPLTSATGEAQGWFSIAEFFLFLADDSKDIMAFQSKCVNEKQILGTEGSFLGTGL